jgi:integrase
MSVYKRANGRWMALLFVERRAGRAIQRSLGTFNTKKAAEFAERAALEARSRGVDMSAARITVGALVERYIERCRTKGLAPASIARYDEIARLHIIPALGAISLSRLTAANVSELYTKAVKSGLSPKSVRLIGGLLSASVRWAMDRDLCVQNVVTKARGDLPKLVRSPARSLTEDEIRRLRSSAAGTPWDLLFLVSLCTGARRSEVAALRWASVDLDHGRATISESLTPTKDGVAFKSTKTGVARVVSLNSVAVIALRAQLARQDAERELVGAGYHNHDLVFATPAGDPWHPRSITNGFARRSREAGIVGARLHDLRHSAATWLLQAGVDVRTVAEVLGHASAVTTMQTYAHVLPGAQEQAVERIADRLNATVTASVGLSVGLPDETGRKSTVRDGTVPRPKALQRGA